MTNVLLSSYPFACNFKACGFKPQLSTSPFATSRVLHYNWNSCTSIRLRTVDSTCNASTSSSYNALEWDDLDEVEDSGTPWEGAILYRRNSSITHLEYCTTLERLGLGQFSSDLSKSTASTMGLRVTKAVKDYPLGTPVLVSIDVTRKKQKLRLDGIIKTVLSLACNR